MEHLICKRHFRKTLVRTTQVIMTLLTMLYIGKNAMLA